MLVTRAVVERVESVEVPTVARLVGSLAAAAVDPVRLGFGLVQEQWVLQQPA